MNFEFGRTGEKRPAAPSMGYSIQKSDMPPRAIGEELFQEGYRLSVTASVEFFSNTAQLPHKRLAAEKSLRAFLYRDALALVDELILVAESPETYELAGRLRSVMLDGDQDQV